MLQDNTSGFFHTKLKVRLWHGGLVHGVWEGCDCIPSLPDAVGLRSLKSRTIIALNLGAGVYSSNTLSLIFSLPIHLLLSKCGIRTCCVTLAYFSGTFRFKMHCIIFGRLLYLFSGIVLHESDSQPGVLLGLKKLQFIYVYMYINTLFRHQI